MPVNPFESKQNMIPAPQPHNEADRIETLRRFAILDTAPEKAFDHITRFAAKQFGVPIALVSLVDSDRQWFKSACGLSETQTPRDLAFCAYTILGDGVHCVPDATKDERFKDNPLVTGELAIRFYCGAPLIASNGHKLGSLCLIDQKPRTEFSPSDQDRLVDLAQIVVDQMEMRIASGNVLGEIETRQAAQSQVAATERQIRALIEHAPVGIALIDRKGRYLAASRSWRDQTWLMLGKTETLDFAELGQYHPSLASMFDDAMAGKPIRIPEDRVCMSDGSCEYVSWDARPWTADSDQVEGVIISATRITDQVTMRKEAERQSELFNAVLENVKDGIVACDANARLTIFNRATREMHGIDRRDLPPEECSEFYSLYEGDGVTPLSTDRIPLFAALKGNAVINREMVIAPDNLPKRQIVAQATPLYDNTGNSIGAVASMADITDAREAEMQLRASEAHANHIAFHDPLTGLPNRAHFLQMSEHHRGKLDTSTIAALFLDLDQFKAVNDTMGHSVGDDVLKRTAETLRKIAGPDAFIGRLGGDEFIAFKKVRDVEEARSLSRQIMADIGKPQVVDGQTVAVGASVGIALSPDHGTDHGELMRRADLAMYKSKAAGDGEPVVFDLIYELETIRRRGLKMELGQAIENGEMDIHFQPIVCGKNQNMRGVEALVRWNHPQKGLISPADFIPIAEESGFIIELGEWVLRTAMERLMQWPDLFLSVNISPVQFRDSLLTKRVFRALDDTGFDPTRLELEITESVLIYDTNVARRVIKTFKDKGIRIALDDFGTGYSSLAYIQSFPFDKVKIDRSFVSDVDVNPQSAAVVRCVINLAASLGMVVTAEGIETTSHEELLKSIGCNTLQGYKYGKPMPIAEIVESQLFHQFLSA